MKLPGISSICIVEAERLPAYVREMAMADVTPMIFLEADQLETGPNATAYSESESTQEGTIHKSSLSFTVDSELPAADKANMAFIIGDASGRFWLMGAKEPPFPKIKLRDDMSTPADGKAAVTYSAEWSSRLILCRFVSPSF